MFGADALLELRRRAERARAAGQETFAIPEAAPVVAFLAATAQGPLRAEAERWLAEGAGYHALVRLAARVVISLDDAGAPGPAVYVPKAAGELEPMLRLWPSVLALPTHQSFTPRDLVALRAFPVHPLGLVATPAWGDGRLCAPAEFFFHDLDHARFKIREDLAVEGLEIPDAYQDGTTLDPRTGQHRIILDAAEGKIGSLLWDRVDARRALAARLLAAAANLPGARAAAARLLLFEVIYEKSRPLDAATLARELGSDAHVEKIRRKQASGFYGDHDPAPATLAALDEARAALLEAL